MDSTIVPTRQEHSWDRPHVYDVLCFNARAVAERSRCWWCSVRASVAVERTTEPVWVTNSQTMVTYIFFAAVRQSDQRPEAFSGSRSASFFLNPSKKILPYRVNIFFCLKPVQGFGKSISCVSAPARGRPTIDGLDRSKQIGSCKVRMGMSREKKNNVGQVLL